MVSSFSTPPLYHSIGAVIDGKSVRGNSADLFKAGAAASEPRQSSKSRRVAGNLP
jgi:hypothetical protein